MVRGSEGRILVYVPLQFVCSYIEKDNDNDDEIDRNPILHFNDMGSLTSHTT